MLIIDLSFHSIFRAYDYVSDKGLISYTSGGVVDGNSPRRGVGFHHHTTQAGNSLIIRWPPLFAARCK